MTNKLTHLSNHTVTAVLATDTLDATELDATIDENLETQSSCRETDAPGAQ